MNPTSSWTFYLRHRRRSALFMSLFMLVTTGIYLLVALVWAIFIEPGRSNYMYLSKFSLVFPISPENGMEPAVISNMRANPDIANVIPTSTVWIALPQVMGGGATGFNLLGLMEEDLPTILERCGATLLEGRLPEPRSNGLLLSKEVVTNLELHVGDTIHDSINSELFGSVVSPMELVGVLDSDVRLGIVSLEFLRNHELYRNFPTLFLVVAQDNREAAVDDFLRDESQANRIGVLTLQKLKEEMMIENLQAIALLAPIIIIVSIAFALVVLAVNRITLSRRLPEFGILYALGRSKQWLVRHFTLETALLAIVGWAMGIGISWLVLYLLKSTLFAPHGQDLDLISWTPIMLTTPIPLIVVGFSFHSFRRIFSRLDPVAIIERGELSLEGQQLKGVTAPKSTTKPLASVTFFKRHRQREVILICAMSMVIMAVVLLIFIDAVTLDARKPGLAYLNQVSIVRPPGAGRNLDPGVVAQIKTQPTVERVITVSPSYALLSLQIPPFLTTSAASPIGVYAEDMDYLIKLYGLELKEGHLPLPHTNEMVISEAVAENRDLIIGDVIGDPDNPAYPGAEALVLPNEFVVSGIFAKNSSPESENWLGFVSLEFLESHEGFNVPDVPPQMVVPKAEQKENLDAWLENEIAGKYASVLTLRQEIAHAQESTHTMMLTIALLEGFIALVAAVALAVLNYIFISQRQAEFGVLHALGYPRLRLVWKTLGETTFSTGTAWGFSVILFLIGLLCLKSFVFKPLGLSFNLFNFTPWLFTLPIPVAVFTITGGTIFRTLSKLDPVSIIERR